MSHHESAKKSHASEPFKTTYMSIIKYCVPGIMLRMVTRNTQDFRFSGLEVVDPWEK